MVPLGNLYHTSIMLSIRFFWIYFMCTELVTLIVSPMYTIHSASRMWNRFYSCLPSPVIYNKTYVHSCLFGYVQMEN